MDLEAFQTHSELGFLRKIPSVEQFNTAFHLSLFPIYDEEPVFITYFHLLKNIFREMMSSLCIFHLETSVLAESVFRTIRITNR